MSNRLLQLQTGERKAKQRAAAAIRSIRPFAVKKTVVPTVCFSVLYAARGSLLPGCRCGRQFAASGGAWATSMKGILRVEFVGAVSKDEKRPAGDHFLNLVKAVAASIPVAASFGSLVNDYLPSWKQKRLEEFVKGLKEDLERHAERIDEAYLKSESAAAFAEQALRGAANTSYREKHERFRAILVNGLADSKLSDEEKEYFVALVDDLTVLHIRILFFMFDPKRYVETNGVKPSAIQHGGFRTMFEKVFWPIPIAVTSSAFADLYRRGLITTDAQIFTTMTAGQGVELISAPKRVSELGQRFVRFISLPRE